MAKEPTEAMNEVVDDEQQDEKQPKDFFVLSSIIKILVYVVGVLIALVAMVVISIVVYTYMNDRGDSQSISTIENQFTSTNQIYSYYDQIPQIRTQTADPLTNSSTVTLSIQLGYNSEEYPHLTEELTRRDPQLTDMFRSYFSQRTAEELSSSNEERIKIELRNAINELLQNGQIEEVVFPEYQILTR